MNSLKSLADIKNKTQMMEVAICQLITKESSSHVKNMLYEARTLLHRSMEWANHPLQIALIGDINSGKSLLLNAFLNTADIHPCLLTPVSWNILSVKVNLSRNEMPTQILRSHLSFLNKFEIEKVLQQYLNQFQRLKIRGIPPKVTSQDLEEFERFLLKKYSKLKSIEAKYKFLNALGFIVSVKNNSGIVEREERLKCPIPKELIYNAIYDRIAPLDFRDIKKTQQYFYERYRLKREKNLEKITADEICVLSPLIRHVEVEVSAWSIPFGIFEPEKHPPLLFLDCPSICGASPLEYLTMEAVQNSHAIMAVFNGDREDWDTSLIKSIFFKIGREVTKRVLVVINRFDNYTSRFCPIPSDCNIKDYYYSSIKNEFKNILERTKSLLDDSDTRIPYLCSALCYILIEKSRKPHWNFCLLDNDRDWFSHYIRLSAYTFFQRCRDDFRKLIDILNQEELILLMKKRLESYLSEGGISELRKDVIHLAQTWGVREFQKQALKAFEDAYYLLEEVIPDAMKKSTRKKQT